MSEEEKEQHKKGLRAPIKALIATAIAFALSSIAVYFPLDISFFAPMQKATDFRFSDFYTMVAKGGSMNYYDPKVVIVPLDSCNRRQMAQAIEYISLCKPAAVGLDITFSAPTNPDEDVLDDALAACPNLVMPVVIDTDYDTIEVSYYDRIVEPSAGFACVNIKSNGETLTSVREFKPKFEVAGEEIPSLPMALAALAAPDKLRQLNQRNKEEEAINYISDDYIMVSPDLIHDNADDIKGKIVLLGKVNDAEDKHITPIGNRTPGVMIHAYSLLTIMSGEYIGRLSQFGNWAIAFIICYLLALLNFKEKETPLVPMAVRALQFVMLILMIYIGTQFYIRLNVDLDFAFVMLTTSLCVVGCDIYKGIFDEKGLVEITPKVLTKCKNYLSHKYESIKKFVVAIFNNNGAIGDISDCECKSENP